MYIILYLITLSKYAYACSTAKGGKMRYQKAAAIFYAVVLAGSITSCTLPGRNGHNDRGTIAAQKAGKVVNGTVSNDKPFHGTDNTTGYRYNLHKSGYGKVAVPIPSSWKIQVISARQVKITDSKTESTVYLDFVPLMEEERMTTSSLISLFKPVLLQEKFTIDGEDYRRYITQSYSQPASNFEENDEKKVMIGYDIEDLAGESTVTKSAYDHIASERRYYFKNEDAAGCISLITRQSEFNRMKKVIDYMASNIQPYEEKFSSGKNLSVEGIHVNLASIFSKTAPAKMGKGMRGTIYRCPEKEESGCAGAFVVVAQTGRKLTPKTADPTALFTQIYPVLENQMGPNDDADIRKMGKTTGYGSIYESAKKAAESNHVKISDGYISTISLLGFSSDSEEGTLFTNGDSWAFEVFQLGDGKERKTVFAAYPVAQANAVSSAVSFR